MMKTCSKCSVEKPIHEFNKNKSRPDGLQTFCRECQKRQYKKYYKTDGERERLAKAREHRRDRLRSIVVDAKSVPCMDCGVEYPHYVMDFDHRDPEAKVTEVANMVARQMSEDSILAEIAKCDVVCSNCHRLRTHIGL